MNALTSNSDHEVRPANPEALREIARMLFSIEVLKQRSSSELSGFLWRIKLKVARHMYRVLVRRTGVFDVETLPKLSPAEQQQLLKTHPLLQPDLASSFSTDLKTDWMQEVEAKVARFADRMTSRRSSW